MSDVWISSFVINANYNHFSFAFRKVKQEVIGEFFQVDTS